MVCKYNYTQVIDRHHLKYRLISNNFENHYIDYTLNILIVNISKNMLPYIFQQSSLCILKAAILS